MRGEVLFTKAKETINGARQDAYGNPEDSFEMIADRWAQYLESRFRAAINLTAADVAFMMVDFKLVRQIVQHKDDNLIDAAGYLGILYDLKTEA